ncbi:MAG: DUF4381 domain-containing protein [Methylococcaceae bacterium]|nr:DUF4381 domain-containing protein [Methylococcaceae bacterium]
MPPTQLPLKDLHLPASIGWWPPAIGWWILAALLIGLIALLFWIYKRLTRQSAVKSAKKLLLALKQDQTLDNGQKLSQLSILMRRVAISQHPRSETASLTGHAWLTFLDRAVTGAPFSTGVGQLLANAQFQKNPPTDGDIANLMRVCENWFIAVAKQTK